MPARDMLVHPNNLPTTQSSFKCKDRQGAGKSMRLGKEYDLKLGAKTAT